MTTALIISTYNRADALWLTLLSVVCQTQLPDEIIIADDGSNDSTKNIIDRFKDQYGIDVIHVWHEDNGFRLAAIRNKAIALAKSDYIIQIDGDLILHRKFVADHIKWAKANTFVSGTRCMIAQPLTRQLLLKNEGKTPSPFSKHLSKRYNGIHSTLISILFYNLSANPNNYKYVLGCNMAFWKKDLLLINGYNESFEGWGKEDNDLSIRLINAGLKLKFIKFSAIVFHLYHPEATRCALQKNENLLQESIDKKTTYIESGLSQYIS
ncbi:MAG: glycosyltransferase family 2 protein [Bacteroidetes bacterium]|nr:glycosyltransferase family 2 protein [Bacteroidota bacterium]